MNGTFPVRNPATLEVIARCDDHTREQAMDALDSAAGALPEWAATHAGERALVLESLACLIEAEAHELARVLVAESGKPIREARREVAGSVACLRWNAAAAQSVGGRAINSDAPGLRLRTEKHPVGVVLAITPWNYPLSTMCRKIAPALAVGCTVIAKPAPETPLSALRLAELALEAELPPDALQVVTSTRAAELVPSWLADPRVRKVAFTGSTAVGRELMRGAAGKLQRVSLELGGNAPVLVFDDADLDRAAADVVGSRYRHAGQTCICAQRLFVQQAVAADLLERITNLVTSLRTGDGMDESTDCGPLIHQRAQMRVRNHVEDARQRGATILSGGSRLSLPSPYAGAFFAPTVLDQVPAGAMLMNEEVFGPVLAVARFDTEPEAIALANATAYGLVAYAYTRDPARQQRLVEALQAGTIGINSTAVVAPQLPFGGWGMSGIGRENGLEGLEEYLEVKSVVQQD